MKTAKQANKQASQQFGTKLSAKLTKLEKEIDSAIERGQFSHTEVGLDRDVHDALLQNGYTVTQGTGDHRDEMCYIITW